MTYTKCTRLERHKLSAWGNLGIPTLEKQKQEELEFTTTILDYRAVGGQPGIQAPVSKQSKANSTTTASLRTHRTEKQKTGRANSAVQVVRLTQLPAGFCISILSDL